MPIYKKILSDETQIFLWKYGEEDFFDEDFLWKDENREKIEKFQKKRRLENLMVRRMLKNKMPNHKILYKENGEPFLEPKSRNISISHSFPFAALAISENRVGIDIERVQEKVKKIKHKFLFPSEYAWIEGENEMEYLTIIWTIKESLYKLHESKLWSFKNHYEISSFHISEKMNVDCRILDTDFSLEFKAKVEKIENYFFCSIIGNSSE